MITRKELQAVLNYCSLTGVFTWVVDRRVVSIGDVAGYINPYGYLVINTHGMPYRAHRLAWLYVYGEWPEQIDHINHNRADNRIINLRDVSQITNSKNLSISKRNTSGVVGVSWDRSKNKWASQIRANKKSRFLGRFDDKFDAICARKSANIKYGFHENHGGSTHGQ